MASNCWANVSQGVKVMEMIFLKAMLVSVSVFIGTEAFADSEFKVSILNRLKVGDQYAAVSDRNCGIQIKQKESTSRRVKILYFSLYHNACLWEGTAQFVCPARVPYCLQVTAGVHETKLEMENGNGLVFRFYGHAGRLLGTDRYKKEVAPKPVECFRKFCKGQVVRVEWKTPGRVSRLASGLGRIESVWSDGEARVAVKKLQPTVGDIEVRYPAELVAEKTLYFWKNKGALELEPEIKSCQYEFCQGKSVVGQFHYLDVPPDGTPASLTLGQQMGKILYLFKNLAYVEIEPGFFVWKSLDELHSEHELVR